MAIIFPGNVDEQVRLPTVEIRSDGVDTFMRSSIGRPVLVRGVSRRGGDDPFPIEVQLDCPNAWDVLMPGVILDAPFVLRFGEVRYLAEVATVCNGLCVRIERSRLHEWWRARASEDEGVVP